MKKVGLSLAERVLVFWCWDGMQAMAVNAVRFPNLWWNPCVTVVGIAGGIADSFQVRPDLQFLCLLSLTCSIALAPLFISDEELVVCLDDTSAKLIDVIIVGAVSFAIF